MRLVWILVAMLAAAGVSGCVAVAVGGAAAGVMVAADRRPPDVMASDERIEWTAQGRISDKFKDQVHINVTSYNRYVLLTGEALTEAIREEAGRIAAAVPDVRGVVNEMSVGAPSAMSARASDSYITSEVKARLVGVHEKVNPIHIKVVTEAGVVYLLGIVTEREAAAATRVARTTGGVKRVVRVFEYIPESAAKPPPPKNQ
ncbi:MAG: BON domain-containing protein [Burkholderiales bacterium]|nr:BON domain-containing protein [Burkholderiales bacterium]